jgi:hypothetical protein
MVRSTVVKEFERGMCLVQRIGRRAHFYAETKTEIDSFEQNTQRRWRICARLIDLIEMEFGKEAPLTKTQVDLHKYLGMTINFSATGKVKFSMIEYIKDMLEGLPNDMAGESATLAANHFFTVLNDKVEKLNTADQNSATTTPQSSFFYVREQGSR